MERAPWVFSETMGTRRIEPSVWSCGGVCSFFTSKTKEKHVDHDQDKNSKLKELVKMIVIVMIPIIALVVMTTLSLTKSAQVYKDANDAQDTIQFSLQVRFLLPAFLL